MGLTNSIRKDDGLDEQVVPNSNPADVDGLVLDILGNAETTSICLSSDGNTVLFGTVNGCVVILKFSNYGQRSNSTLQLHRDPVNQVSISSDGKIGASASADGNVIIFDVPLETTLRTISCDEYIPSGVSLSKDGMACVVGFRHRKALKSNIYLFRSRDEEKPAWEDERIIREESTYVLQLFTTSDADRVFVILSDGTSKVLAILPDLRCVTFLELDYYESDRPFGSSMSRTGENVSIMDWSRTTSHCLRLNEEFNRRFDDYDYEFDARRDVGLSDDGKKLMEMKKWGINLRDSRTGEILTKLSSINWRLRKAAMSGNGETVVAANFDNRAVVWRLAEVGWESLIIEWRDKYAENPFSVHLENIESEELAVSLSAYIIEFNGNRFDEFQDLSAILSSLFSSEAITGNVLIEGRNKEDLLNLIESSLTLKGHKIRFGTFIEALKQCFSQEH